MSTPAPGGFLVSGQASEFERLRLQSVVGEPAGRLLLARLPAPLRGARVLAAGCGMLGWLRILEEWVGVRGEMVGVDFANTMLAGAGEFVRSAGLSNVRLVNE